MKKRRRSPNVPKDEGARLDYFGCSQNGGMRTHFMGAAMVETAARVAERVAAVVVMAAAIMGTAEPWGFTEPS